jgi:hypothetical protein
MISIMGTFNELKDLDSKKSFEFRFSWFRCIREYSNLKFSLHVLPIY